MATGEKDLVLQVAGTSRRCPIGETVGERNLAEGRIPVLSCEGACIRGEIARLAAGMVAQRAPYGRACHGELLTAPDSAIARWVRSTRRVVLIDGCFMRCHGRILERLLGADRVTQFDALSVHRRFGDVFEVDDVPEAERRAAARQVADHVLGCLEARGEPRAGPAAAEEPCHRRRESARDPCRTERSDTNEGSGERRCRST